MTDKRMEYMQDALGYIEDEYIQEAAEALGHARRKKEQRRMIKVRVIQAAAVLVILLLASEVLEISGYKWNGVNGVGKETAAGEWKGGETYAPNGTDKESDLLYESFHYQQETHAGNSAGENTEPPMDGIDSAQNPSSLTAEEIFAQNTAIFKGTVDGMEYYKGTGKDEIYFAVVEVIVSECYQGDMKEGEICKIFIPLIPGYSTNSMAGNLDKLTAGSEAIFMPNVAGAEDSFLIENGSIAYNELADYYFVEGQRYLFLELDGRMYYDSIFDVETENAYATMDDVVSYVKGMLE